MFSYKTLDENGTLPKKVFLSSSQRNINEIFLKALETSKSSPSIVHDLKKEKFNSKHETSHEEEGTDDLNSSTLWHPFKSLINLYKKFWDNKNGSFKRYASLNENKMKKDDISDYYDEGGSLKRSFSLRPEKFKDLDKIDDIYHYCNAENTFSVKLRKESGKLGLSIYGGMDASKKDPFYHLIRIWNLHPSQPALECGKLNLGDVILEVNGISLFGLTVTGAADVLRAAADDVELKIFRPSRFLLPHFSEYKRGICADDQLCSSSDCDIVKNEGTRISNEDLCVDKASPTSDVNILKTTCEEPCVDKASPTSDVHILKTTCEFKVTLRKMYGFFGFKIARFDHTGGIFIKALTRPNAFFNGRLRAGDRILQVDGIDISHFPHTEIITWLKTVPHVVTLTICRNCNAWSSCEEHSKSEKRINKLPKAQAFKVILSKSPNVKMGNCIWNPIANGPETWKNFLPAGDELKIIYSGKNIHMAVEMEF